MRRPVHDKWLHRIEAEVDHVDGWRCPPPFVSELLLSCPGRKSERRALARLLCPTTKKSPSQSNTLHVPTTSLEQQKIVLRKFNHKTGFLC